ncbi:hypothetical protein [Aliiglaciecola sp. LCG003]|uniref:hypothetical protein n=1 Tax=Aliiglaciecola sp. LCG003 TaxID=3053655 RepID=UPI002573954D|nr:hypothetical protein [Aliiglaciecola sp. LCG003]WJG09217.1 hypothetical protein QR722_18100 [Aliiglaciecola sp. LCG003]
MGNRPSAPIIAVVGITPGSQSTEFAKLLKTTSIEEAAKQAAFAGAQNVIKKMLSAHGFANSIGIDLSGDINDSEAIFTTSLVKCCLKRKSAYLYKAPDILKSEEAVYCIKNKFLNDLNKYLSIRFIALFGQPSWEAINGIYLNGQTIKEYLESQGKIVLNFPHFAQNFQQRELFCSSEEEFEAILKAKPKYQSYALNAKQLKTALFNAVPNLSPNSSSAENQVLLKSSTTSIETKMKPGKKAPSKTLPKAAKSGNNLTSADGFISDHNERKLHKIIETLGLTTGSVTKRSSKELAVFNNSNILCYISRKTGLTKGQMVVVIHPDLALKVDKTIDTSDNISISVGKSTRYISSSNYKLFDNVGDCPELESNEPFGAAYRIQVSSDFAEISDFLNTLIAR